MPSYNSKLPVSGDLRLSTIQDEFGGVAPIGMDEYYRGGAYVPNITPNAAIPSVAGQPNKTSFFYGTVKSTATIIKTVLYTTPGTYSVIVPDGCASVSLSAAGGGGGGAGGAYYVVSQRGSLQTYGPGAGGGGGSSAYAYINNYTNITAGQVLTVVVGSAGLGGRPINSGTASPGSSGSESYVAFSTGQKIVSSSGGGGGQAVTADPSTVSYGAGGASGSGYDINGTVFSGALGSTTGAGGSNAIASGGAARPGGGASYGGSGGAGFLNGASVPPSISGYTSNQNARSGADGGSGGVRVTFNDIVKQYPTAGTYQFTVPEGVYQITVTVIAAGGTGNYVGNNSTNNSGSGGGGAGFRGTLSVSPGQVYNVVVGASPRYVGETTSSNGPTSGASGGQSRFYTSDGTVDVTCNGGGGSSSFLGSRGGQAYANGGTGGSVASQTGSWTNITAASGGAGQGAGDNGYAVGGAPGINGYGPAIPIYFSLNGSYQGLVYSGRGMGYREQISTGARYYSDGIVHILY